jgi:putative DNA primase/helicase
LRGARLVSVNETEEGRTWSESRIKELTGGTPVPAHFMRQDDFEFVPRFKLWFSGNNRPRLKTVNKAIKRRVNMILFSQTISEDKKDKTLRDEGLKDEWPGILAWAIEGCLEWQKKGLRPPQAVLEATEEYLDSENTYKTWFDDCIVVVGQEQTILTNGLFASWKHWAEEHNERVGHINQLSEWLKNNGYKKVAGRADGRRFYGLAVAL